MATIRFTKALKRFYPHLEPMTVKAGTVGEMLDLVEGKHPGLKNYLVDEHGHLRKHVNIFIGSDLIKDQENLSDQLSESDSLYIMQALSGG